MSNEIASEQIRNRFEVWAKSANYELHRGQVTGDYMHTPTSYAWEAWQAAEREQSPAVVTDEIVRAYLSAVLGWKPEAFNPCDEEFIDCKAGLEAVAPLLQSPAVDHARGDVAAMKESINIIANNIGESLNVGCSQQAVDAINKYVDELFSLAASPTPGESDDNG